MSDKKKIYLASPRGFCAGVRRALETVEKALGKYGPPVYVLHEIVHNEYVVNSLRKQGVIFVEDLTEIPEGSLVIFSAHGISREKEEQAIALGLRVVDATCPLVKKIHDKAILLEKQGTQIVLIGHSEHPEVEGTLGQLSQPASVIEKISDLEQLGNISEPVAFLTQTTLSVDDTKEIVTALRKRFPGLVGSGDICYATHNRQRAVKQLAEKCDLVLIVGSLKSSNSTRLREVAEQCGAKALLINDPAEVSSELLRDLKSIGISAGASAPECLVQELISLLRQEGWELQSIIETVEENVQFQLPEL